MTGTIPWTKDVLDDLFDMDGKRSNANLLDKVSEHRVKVVHKNDGHVERIAVSVLEEQQRRECSRSGNMAGVLEHSMRMVVRTHEEEATHNCG